MDEERLIDWYDVVQSIANGRLTGHRCPSCHEGTLETGVRGGVVRARCPACGEGFEGRMAHGRDDALYAEAGEVLKRQAARQAAPEPAPEPQVQAAPAQRAPEPAAEPPEPWTWQLPARGQDDWEGYGNWVDVVEAIYNGRRSGLQCPFCSEPLDAITVQDPYIRVRCGVCGEGFEGRFG